MLQRIRSFKFRFHYVFFYEKKLYLFVKLKMYTVHYMYNLKLQLFIICLLFCEEAGFFYSSIKLNWICHWRRKAKSKVLPFNLTISNWEPNFIWICCFFLLHYCIPTSQQPSTDTHTYVQANTKILPFLLLIHGDHGNWKLRYRINKNAKKRMRLLGNAKIDLNVTFYSSYSKFKI